MFRTRFLPAILALTALGLLAASGCKTETAGNGRVRDFYRIGQNYAGPLQVGRPYNTVERITFTTQGGDHDPSVSPDGKRMIYASTVHSERPDIYMKSLEKSSATRVRLTNTPWAEAQPCFSPDGRHFAYASNRRGNWDIAIGHTDGRTKPTLLTQNRKSDDISPSWHPDGEHIAFSSFDVRSGAWEIAIKSTESGRTYELGEGRYPKFSPRGDKLVFQRARDREPRWFSIWTIDLGVDFNLSAPTEVVSNANWAAINPNWSPDGKYLVFATVHESPLAQHTRRLLSGDDIWLVNLDGQDLIRLTHSLEPESSPVWTKNAEGGNGRIYFCSMRKGPKNIWSLLPVLPDYSTVKGVVPGPRADNLLPAEPAGGRGLIETPRIMTSDLPPPATSGSGSR